jgi:Protein kinase domain/Domain of unknown function (DUF4352)
MGNSTVPPLTTTALQPGDPEMLGRFSVAARLGQGGMGTVYLAHGEDGRPVAIKVIRPELAGDAGFRARFAAEILAARRVTASCTARVLEAEPDAERPWFATEYVDGMPLDRLVATRGPLPPSSVEGLAVGVAAALTAIHAAGLVHRDLKPANVLVSPFGPKVIDFGIARTIDGAGSATMTGIVLGTPGWIAPELLAGMPPSPAADLFAWGCLVAFAASGRPPFGDGPAEEVARRPASRAPDLGAVPQSLRGLVTAATDRDPRRRPAARELLLSLLGDRAAGDPQGAVTQALQRTWAAPSPAPASGWAAGWGPPTATAPASGWDPPTATAPVPRRPWYRRKLVLVPLGVVALLLVMALNQAGDHGSPSGSGSGPVATSRPPAANGGTRASTTTAPARSGGTGGRTLRGRDGKLEFTVLSVSCGHRTAGQPPLRAVANGQYCFVRLQVRNLADQAWTPPVNQFLWDTAGERHSIDPRGSIALGGSRLLTQLAPRQRASGTLVFELPTGAKPERLVLHDSLLSFGVSIGVRRE